jgi:hypothetical protein
MSGSSGNEWNRECALVRRSRTTMHRTCILDIDARIFIRLDGHRTYGVILRYTYGWYALKSSIEGLTRWCSVAWSRSDRIQGDRLINQWMTGEIITSTAHWYIDRSLTRCMYIDRRSFLATVRAYMCTHVRPDAVHACRFDPSILVTRPSVRKLAH